MLEPLLKPVSFVASNVNKKIGQSEGSVHDVFMVAQGKGKLVTDLESNSSRVLTNTDSTFHTFNILNSTPSDRNSVGTDVFVKEEPLDDDDARAGAREGVSRKNDPPPEPPPKSSPEPLPDRPSQNDLLSRGRRVCEAMGIAFDDPGWRGDFTVLASWDAQGFDFELDVLPAITGVMHRRRQRTREPVASLSYFTREIQTAHRRRLAPPEPDGGPPQTRPTSFDDQQKARIEAALADVFGSEEE